MSNIETGLQVSTNGLGQFARDVVDSKVLEGQCKGKHGWDADDPEVDKALRNKLQNLLWDNDYAAIMVYATMLQARIYNSVGMQKPIVQPQQPSPPNINDMV